ncbi:MAG: T9SS type A sorting domain-containing protein [bacterium]
MKKSFYILSILLFAQVILSAQVQLVSPANYSRFLPPSRVELTWVDDPAINLYRVEVAISSEFTQETILFTVNPFTNKSVLTNLSYDTDYFWRVRDELAPDTWSEVWTFKTTGMPVPPVITSPITNSKNVPDSVLYVWSQDSVNSRFMFQLSNNPNFANLIVQSTSEQNSYKVQNLSFETEYFARVKAYNVDNNESEWSNIVKIKTALPTPYQITPANNARVEPFDVDFSWQGGGTATNYIFQLGYDTLLVSKIEEQILQRTRLTLEEVDFDTTFYWRIKAFNGVGDSSGWAASKKFRSKPIITFSPKVINDTINYSLDPVDYIDKLHLKNDMAKAYVIEKIFIQPDSIFIPDKFELTLPPNTTDSIGITVDTSKVKLGNTKGKLYFVKGLYSDEPDTTIIEINLEVQKANAVLQTKKVVFDTTKSGQISYEDIFIKNQGGNIQLEIDSVFISGIDTAAFHFTNYDKLIDPGISGRVYVMFEPQNLGEHTALLHILTNSFPIDSFAVPLSGVGKGGLISDATIETVESYADSLFETFNHNYLPLTIENAGNYPLKFHFDFVEDYFAIYDEDASEFTLQPGKNKQFFLQYLTPNFDTLNVDTLKIYHDGLGDSPLLVPIQGTFDSLTSTTLLRDNIIINNEPLQIIDYMLNENTAIQVWLGEGLIDKFDKLDFRVMYYKGGPGKRIFAVDAGSNRYIIPYTDITSNGLIFSGEIVAKDESNSIVDSVTVFHFLDTQILLENFTTKKITVPISKPASTPDKADVKWMMFGFPFDEVFTDTVFSAFGGVDNMEDGEWVLYDYDPAAEEGFSLFKKNTFTKNKAYFVAQSLRDSYEIFYKYENMVQTRKLTDTVMTLSGSNWITVSSPYPFDVEVDSSVTLRKYDPYNKTYKFTNIMRPGEGYFVEPGIERIVMKTFGEYYPSLFPKIFSAVGWHIDLKLDDGNSIRDILMSVDRGNKLSKVNSLSSNEFEAAPRIDNGFDCFILSDENNNLDASVKAGKEGAAWDVILRNDLKDDIIKINPDIVGIIPQDMSCRIYDCAINKLYNAGEIEINLNKGFPKKIKVIIGTENFIANTIANLNENIPTEFTLYQNYPNPFNPATMIKYYLPEEAVVQIKIFDILGREVDRILDCVQTQGVHEINFSGEKLASGVYFYQINIYEIGSERHIINTETKKMMLLK